MLGPDHTARRGQVALRWKPHARSRRAQNRQVTQRQKRINRRGAACAWRKRTFAQAKVCQTESLHSLLQKVVAIAFPLATGLRNEGLPYDF
jgi:hypothetical protein